jgi:hypothetical protein
VHSLTIAWVVHLPVNAGPSAFPSRRAALRVPHRRDRLTVWQQFTQVVEEHDVIAEQTPSLLGMGSYHPRAPVIRRVGGRASGLVVAHRLRLRDDAVAAPSPLQSPELAYRLHPGNHLLHPASYPYPRACGT